LFAAGKRYITSINGDGFYCNFGWQNIKGGLQKSGEAMKTQTKNLSKF